MKKFKVGRGTVRAAYHSLQQKGLIEIRHGGGAFVQEIDSSVAGDTLSTLIRYRRISTQHLQECQVTQCLNRLSVLFMSYKNCIKKNADIT